MRKLPILALLCIFLMSSCLRYGRGVIHHRKDRCKTCPGVHTKK